MSRTFVADFETTTNSENCHVWAYAVTEVGNSDHVDIGTTIDDFMEWCKSQHDNPTVLFHNLKFDGQFIIYWLFHHGFKCVEQKDRATNTFTTMISDKGLWYTIEVIFKLKGKKVKKVVFQDSLKLIPLSVDGIAKSFKLDMQKLSIDYRSHDDLPIGSPLTKEEEDYIKHDVKIVAHAVDFFYKNDMQKMTIGSCALEEYKKLIKKKNFNNWFPTPKYHDDVKESYKGGFTWLNPKFANKRIGKGIVLDVNSLYPSVMYYKDLPYGTPIWFEGEYEEDYLYPLYIQSFTCSFEVKKNKIPSMQIKNSQFGFKATEYLTSSEGHEVPLCLTNVDLQLFKDQYDLYNVEYHGGWMFKATQGLFTEYIDKWTATKIKSKEEGNHGMYTISKLMLNSLYGKFGTSTRVKEKQPYLDEELDIIRYRDCEESSKDGVYIPIASFITSYAREITIRAAQKIQDDYYSGKSKIQFVYADTDSLHCISEDFSLPDLDIHPTRLGAWDHEADFKSAKFIRSKCYIEKHIISQDDYEKGHKSDKSYLYSKEKDGFYILKVTVAGMPKSCHKEVTFNNFKIGASYSGKLQPKIVTGGAILKDIEFTIKDY